MGKSIILCDCKPNEIASLCSALDSDSKPFEVRSHIANWKRSGKLSELRRYIKYFAVAFKYFLNREDYDVIIGWQQFYALIFGFFCSIFHVKKNTMVVVLNYTYKEKNGPFSKIYRWFMAKCLDGGYIDYLLVLSSNYAKIISEEFNFPLDRIVVSPFGINDPYDKFSKLSYPKDAPLEGYVLSIGRSNRDYDFLISAWENIRYPLIIISDTYKGSNRNNPYVRTIDNVAGEDSYPWISNCSAMIIPIDDGSICSGDTVLLTSLAMKKKTLITTPSTLAEMYIIHGENGLSVSKEKAIFETLVSDMIFTDKYDYLHNAARENYLNNYSRYSMGKKLKELIF